MIIIQIIGITIGIIVLYLLIVTFGPGFTVPEQPLEKWKQPTKDIDAKPPLLRKDVSFKVKGTSISAWLYLPENLSAPVPCIIMGHGFGGTKDMIMESYALRYQEAGFAALTFDYRHFGQSEGEPRQLFSIPYQLQDYAAAVEYARSLKEIDPTRIALWGTSGSGGHVVVAAAKDKNIACVIAQCPGLDPHASVKTLVQKVGFGHIVRMFVHGQRDIVRSRFGLSPHKIPIVGKPGSIAFFPISDAYDGYSRLAPENFINEVCARIILRSHGYRPAKHARNVQCPVLIQICDHDSLAPISAGTEKELKKHAELKHYPIGHFDIYTGDNFEKSVSDQLEFLKKHL
jgi:pimeloyl-ACP methyl ester carboxylesterase